MRRINFTTFTPALAALALSSLCSADVCTGDAGEPVAGLTNDYCNGDKPIISTGLYTCLNVETLGATYVDEDCFIVELAPLELLRVTVYFDDVDGGGDIDLLLYDLVALQNPCGPLFPAAASSTFSTTCSESLQHFNPYPFLSSQVVIRVNMKLGQFACTNYDLQVEIQGRRQGESYCGSFSDNSAGCGAVLHSEEGLALSADLIVSNLPAGQVGIFFYGPDPANQALGCGTRCIGGSVTRIFPPAFSNSCGVVTRNVTLPAFSRVQFWYRDSAHFTFCGDSHNLSNAIRLPY